MGVREKIERVIHRRILDHMPDQHREFYASLPFVLLGSSCSVPSTPRVGPGRRS
jgi:predicted pyridoxine 5'-phosphate oxidase superfamily flavin-nucleotide-binding protein